MFVADSLEDMQISTYLRSGAIGVLPTDTLYGLVCKAADKTAVERLYALKSRKGKPGTIIAASIDQLVGLGIPRRYLTAVAGFWPNAISIVIPSAPGLEYIDQGMMSLAVRIPDDVRLARLLEVTGPLLTTSANLPGKTPAHSIDQAKRYFGDSVDFYVDEGERVQQAGSTVIRIIDDAVEILREGVVKINERGEIQP